MAWLWIMLSQKRPWLAKLTPIAIAVLKSATIAMLRGRVANSASLGIEGSALVLDHALPERGARAEEEYPKAVEREADAPAHERPHMPGTGRRELGVDQVEGQVHRGEDGGVDVEAELGSGAFAGDTIKILGSHL